MCGSQECNLLAFLCRDPNLLKCDTTLASRMINFVFIKKGDIKPITVFMWLIELSTTLGLFFNKYQKIDGIAFKTLFFSKKTTLMLLIIYAASFLKPVINKVLSYFFESIFWATKEMTRSAPPAVKVGNTNNIFLFFFIFIKSSYYFIY